MKVQKHEVTKEQINAAVVAMNGLFTVADVSAALIGAGVPEEDNTAELAALRILERERKAGRIQMRPDSHWEITTP